MAFDITVKVPFMWVTDLNMSSLPNERMARLQLTDDLIGDLSSTSQAQEAEQDLQKIQEILSLPRNEGVAQDSDSQWQWAKHSFACLMYNDVVPFLVNRLFESSLSEGMLG